MHVAPYSSYTGEPAGVDSTTSLQTTTYVGTQQQTSMPASSSYGGEPTAPNYGAYAQPTTPRNGAYTPLTTLSYGTYVSPTNTSATDVIPATQSQGAYMTPGVTAAARSGSKAAQRQEEIARQVGIRERELASLQQRQFSNNFPPSSAPASSVAPSSSASGGEAEVIMAAEVERLKQEVDRLQEQQKQMLWELNDVPPPMYE